MLRSAICWKSLPVVFNTSEACIAVNDSLLVNLPAHLTEVCEQMRADEEAVDAINHGQAGFKIYEYASKSGVIRYSVDWVDLQ